MISDSASKVERGIFVPPAGDPDSWTGLCFDMGDGTMSPGCAKEKRGVFVPPAGDPDSWTGLCFDMGDGTMSPGCSKKRDAEAAEENIKDTGPSVWHSIHPHGHPPA